MHLENHFLLDINSDENTATGLRNRLSDQMNLHKSFKIDSDNLFGIFLAAFSSELH